MCIVLLGAALLPGGPCLQVRADVTVTQNEMGISAYEAGRFEEAIAYFEKAYEQAPDNDTLRHNLCNALQAQAKSLADTKDLQPSVKYLETAISVDPENVSPLIQLGSYYLHMNLVRDAIFRLEEAIELKPGELNAHELLGEAYYRDNDIASARAQWDYVLEVEPKRPGLRERYDKAFREQQVEAEFKQNASRHFNISYPDDVNHTQRSQILYMLERAYDQLGRKLGGIYPPSPIQVILYSDDQFKEATLLDAHIGAVFDGKIRAPLTDAAGNWLPEEEVRRRLTHEYVHVIVRHAAGASVPWWLNEGLAETLSNEMSAEEQQILSRTYAQNAAFNLSALEGSQLKKLTPEALRLAYIQAHATVNMLWTKYGHVRMAPFLQALSFGESGEGALKQSYRKSYAVLEQELAHIYQ
ncbi:MAG: tetratricopeptide repeat protein [Candidatus Hydrogenedentes bacterium]|nr:tetratricopeptide repeat protein [Candidatus Hydrogenedentota bacterium]